jgi:hypothetical protein
MISRQPMQHATRRGAVLVVVLIGMTLLVGLVFFVFNLGDQVNRRLDMQNAADAAAASGAGWQARSLNLAAMTNTGQAKMIATALALDAVPLAAELALIELQTSTVVDDGYATGLAKQLHFTRIPDRRLERGFARPADLRTVVADAILFVPEVEKTITVTGGDPADSEASQVLIDAAEFVPVWPGDSSTDPRYDYNQVRALIAQHGRIVDNRDGGFSASGDWSESAAVNEYRGSSQGTLDAGATATWQVSLPADQKYHVYVWCSSDTDGSHRYPRAAYTIQTAAGPMTITVNQNVDTGAWRRVASHVEFPADGSNVLGRVSLAGPPDDADREQELTNFLIDGLELFYDEIRQGGKDDEADDQAQYDELVALDRALDSPDENETEGGFDIRQTTWWSGPSGQGQLWRAAMDMRDMGRAAMEQLGPLAQANAARFGTDSGATTALVLPMTPAVPYRRGEWSDFTPVLTGRVEVDTVSQSARMTLPIYQEIAKINTLDEALDDLMGVHNDVDLRTLADGTVRPEADGLIDLTTANLLDLQQGKTSQVRDRVSQMETLAGHAEGLVGQKHYKDIRETLEEIREQVGSDQPQTAPADGGGEDDEDEEEDFNLASLITLHIELSMELLDEMQREMEQKDGLLLSLDRKCPGGGLPENVGDSGSGPWEVPLWRLGPYAQLHRWRFTRWQWDRQSGPGWTGINGIWGSAPSGRRGEETGFTVYGPYRWALLEVLKEFGKPGEHSGDLDATRFSHYATWLANIKLGYGYGLRLRQVVRYTTAVITDYTEARAFAANPETRSKILRTRYYAPRVMSSLSWDHPDWLKDTSTYFTGYWPKQEYLFVRPDIEDPAAMWIWEPAGWYDVAAGRTAARKLVDHVWVMQVHQDDVRWEHRVGLEHRRSAEDGQTIPWNLYSVQWFVFGGIEIGEKVAVANPMNWPDGADLPAPLVMLTDEERYEYTEDHDTGARREFFTQLGLAGRGVAGRVWAEQFSGGNPAGQSVAVAQSEVFNTSSWDLWTQDWQSQLVPVTRWGLWQEVFADGLGQVGDHEELNEDDVRAMQEYIDGISEEMAELFMQH